jgi:2-amino-4-hydroxy-6-hydroxymethyldihydropteridine diphosphokinase
MRAGIAFGSNLGDRLANLKGARLRVEQLPKVQPPVVASAIYETEPVDCEPGAPKFFNAVIEIDYSGEAAELLRELRGIEADYGRAPKHTQNVSRSLDLDLLYFGTMETSSPELQVPHPRILGRRFVLEPLHDVRPDLILPAQTKTVGALLQDLPATPRVVRVASEW